MAIIIHGKTSCAVCGDLLEKGEELAAFPAVISNQADPLYQLNDRAFHEGCLADHPLCTRILDVMQTWQERTEFRACTLCKSQITDPDEHVIFPYFGNGLLPDLSFAQFHRSCLANWGELNDCIAQIERLNNSVSWDGDCLDHLLSELRRL